jgi:hypothetical protein
VREDFLLTVSGLHCSVLTTAFFSCDKPEQANILGILIPTLQGHWG